MHALFPKKLMLLTTLPFMFVACGDSAREAAPADLPEVATWALEAEARIGDRDDDWLTRVGKVLIGPEGQLYLSQPRDGEIRMYDIDSEHVATIGRRGQGPGEFNRLGGIGFLGDTLYASDAERINFFASDGRFIHSVPWSPEVLIVGESMYAPAFPNEFVLRVGGMALVKPAMMEAVRLGAGENSGPSAGVTSVERRVPFVRLEAGSDLADTIAWETTRVTIARIASGGEIYSMRNPFGDDPLFTVMQDGRGIVSVDRPAAQSGQASSYLVTLVDPAGDTLFSRSHAYAPVPMQAEDVDEALGGAAILPDSEGGPSASAFERSLRGNDLIPEYHAPVSAVAVGQDGTIWLKRENQIAETIVWNVLDDQGRLQGAVALPRDQTVVAASGTVMVAVELDELDVPRVVRYRVSGR